jgi:hypothetical protein
MTELEQPALSCENCGAPYLPEQKFCQQCRFPVGGTDADRQNFRIRIGRHEEWLRDANKQTRTSKIIIYILAGLFLLFGLIQGFGASEDFPLMIVNLIMCVAYLVLAAWADKNPFGAILTALIIYVTIQVLNMFIEPISIVKGIIMKIIIISALVKGVRSAKEAQDLRKKIAEFKGTTNE